MNINECKLHDIYKKNTHKEYFITSPFVSN